MIGGGAKRGTVSDSPSTAESPTRHDGLGASVSDLRAFYAFTQDNARRGYRAPRALGFVPCSNGREHGGPICDTWRGTRQRPGPYWQPGRVVR